MNTTNRPAASWCRNVVPAVLAPAGRCTDTPAGAFVDNIRAALAPQYPHLAALWSEERAAGLAVDRAREAGDTSRRFNAACRAYNAAWDRAAAAARIVLRCGA